MSPEEYARAEGIPLEPNANARQLAVMWRQLHAALLYEGFAPEQAIYLVGQFVAASVAAGIASKHNP